jgi:DNA-binding SARP family transcriptional activator/pimeloyl-ACP methyl ester carboxylesterase
MLVQVLGGVSLRSAANEVAAVPGSRQPALLAALAARVGQVVSADLLIDLLWGADLPENPLATLHSTIFKLRSHLVRASAGREVLITREPGYLLDLGPDDVDSLRFARLVDTARVLPAERAEPLLAEALSLWHGRAFGHFADSEIAHIEALRLEEMRLSAIETRAEALFTMDRPGEAVSVLHPFVREHPLREGARILLMRSLDRQGRTTAALDQFHEHRAYLAEELGLEPSDALKAAQAELLRAPGPETPDATRGWFPPGSQAVAPSAGRPPLGLTGLRVRYLRTSSGGTLAYGTTGTGPPIVVILGWVSSLDVIASGRDPRSSLLQRLTGDATLTLYDRAGTGLSPGPVTDFGLRASVDELVELIEAVGKPVALMAMSAAGPIALTVAHDHPDWVSSLVLFGTFCDGPSTFRDERLRTMIAEIVRTYWGMGSKMLADLYRPGLSDEAAWHLAKMFRDSAEPEVAANYLASMYHHDVSALLADITTPALVLHYRSDRLIWFRGGQDLAAGLPNATFLPLDGRFHLPDAADLDTIEEAISSHVRRHAPS